MKDGLGRDTFDLDCPPIAFHVETQEEIEVREERYEAEIKKRRLNRLYPRPTLEMLKETPFAKPTRGICGWCHWFETGRLEGLEYWGMNGRCRRMTTWNHEPVWKRADDECETAILENGICGLWEPSLQYANFEG